MIAMEAGEWYMLSVRIRADESLPVPDPLVVADKINEAFCPDGSVPISYDGLSLVKGSPVPKWEPTPAQ